jgi:hypothetical protein
MLRPVTVLLALLTLAHPAHALFHASVIDEAYLGNDADTTGQFLEIRMLAPVQTFVSNSVITTFSCDGQTTTDLLVIPTDIANGGTNLRWLMATDGDTPFSTLFGMHADFYVSGHFPIPCGQVCWGAPVSPSFKPPTDPASWSHSQPSNFVDCIAYGGYTGPTRTGQLPTDGSVAGGLSYQRTAHDFGPSCPSPTNNAGDTGSISGCVSPPTTTTVTSTTSTTSTSVPPLTGQALTGKLMKLKEKAGKPDKSHATVVSTDTSVALGGGNGSVDDPTLHDGSLRLASSAGGALFDATYELPMAGWKYVGKSGKNKGYKWKGTVSQGPAASVLVKAGHAVKVSIHGSGLDIALGANPSPVAGTLRIGNREYCLRFGGTTTFKADASFTAKAAPAPASCP